MPEDLGSVDDRLKDIYLIKGVGLSSNIYMIGKDDVTLIDIGVGNAMNRIAPKIGELGLKIENISQVILTHAHHDHVGGLFEVLLTSPRVFIHSSDAEFLRTLNIERLVRLRDRDTVETAGRSLTVFHTPGHTPGSICLYEPFEKLLFSGDTVFPGGRFGRYSPRSGGISAMIRSLKRLTNFSVDVMLPGHGDPVLKNAGEHISVAFETALLFKGS